MDGKVKEDLVSDISRSLQCGVCNLQYYIKDFSLKVSRCPMLLNCGHSICKKCLRQNIRALKKIICSECKSDCIESLESGNTFRPNFYEVGSLFISQNLKVEKDRKLLKYAKSNFDFTYTQKKQLNAKINSELDNEICEECSLNAIWYCENCKSNFCEVCWSTVHTSAKSLMKHCKMPVSSKERKRHKVKKCSLHETQDLEFFCKGCSTAVCSYCVILKHQGEGHCPVTLKEKNWEMIGKIKTAVEEAELVSKRMKQTLEKVKLGKNSFEEPNSRDFSELGNQITKKFSQLHGILQLEEERLLKILEERSIQRENCFKILQTQLEEQIENLDILLRECELMVNNPSGSNFTELHKQLEEVQNLPCYLISQKTGTEEPKITFDDSFIKSALVYCTLELPSSEVYELRSSSNLPEDYAVEPLSPSDSEKNFSIWPKDSSLSDIDTLSCCSSRDSRKRQSEMSSLKDPTAPKVFIEKKNYNVIVSYIKSPGEFYVTLNSQRLLQQAINDRASEFASSSTQVPKSFSKGEIYLVKYGQDKKWYRARVVEVLPHKKMGKESCVLVYYLDYGNSEIVPTSRLRPIPPDILEGPPLAIKCKLFDCVPKNGDWCPESTKTMEKILNDYTAATMYVMKIHPDCLEVDLSINFLEDEIGRDIVSVRDALLFLEYSSFVHGSKVPRNTKPVKYLPQDLPMDGENFNCIISYVNSPSDFYIQKTFQNASYLCKLFVDLEKYYEENSEKSFIYNPVVDMPCAALFSADQKWYRAKILDMPGKKKVTVFYVDFGNTEILDWSKIRKLKDCFTKWPPVALNCTLAGIHPTETHWKPQAKEYLENCIIRKGFRAQISGGLKSSDKLKILLYRTMCNTEICINTLFLEKGFAVISGPNMKKGSEDENEEILTLNGDKKYSLKVSSQEEDQTISDAEMENFNFNEGRRKLSAKKLRELYEEEKKLRINEEYSDRTEEVENDFDACNNILKVKVKVLSAESPSSIYVTFSALMKELENLQSKLREFYQNSSPEDPAKEWTVDNLCAVFHSEKNSWYRGRIIDCLANGQVKLFLKDIAAVSIQPVSALRELDSSFTKYATCSVKCHLAGIAPPGEQWPSVSCEYLLNELENYNKIYMTKRGHIENRSLPVELWVETVVSMKALEPTVTEWITLNRLLVKEGLAVPVKIIDKEVEEKPRDEAVPDEKEEKVPDADLPTLDSAWLPPEPMTRSRFIGIPTYVDFSAFIYLYDFEQDANKLKAVSETLNEEYENSKPYSIQFWSSGEICIAKYHVDGNWYRGVVLQTNEDLTYEVLFVDYGNVETCAEGDLRKKIKTHDIPILSHKCQLHGIKPVSEDGKWSVQVTDTLHSLIVDKKCEINIVEFPLDEAEPYCVNIKLVDVDVDVCDFLIKQGVACRKSLTSDPDNYPPVKNSSVDVSESKDKPFRRGYISLSIPENCEAFSIKVTAIESETEFLGKIVDDEHLAPSLKLLLKKFTRLKQDLMKECHLQRLIENFTEGQPCCCLYSKNKWRRGEIESISECGDSVCVSFVDYGNKECLKRDFLHECKDTWIDLPKMAIKFKLHNVKKCTNVLKSVYMNALASCLKNLIFFAVIKNRDGLTLELELLNKIGGTLAYEELIDGKFMIYG